MRAPIPEKTERLWHDASEITQVAWVICSTPAIVLVYTQWRPSSRTSASGVRSAFGCPLDGRHLFSGTGLPSRSRYRASLVARPIADAATTKLVASGVCSVTRLQPPALSMCIHSLRQDKLNRRTFHNGLEARCQLGWAPSIPQATTPRKARSALFHIRPLIEAS